MKLKFSKIVNRELKKVEMFLYGPLGEESGEINGHYFAQEMAWVGRNYDEITIRLNCEGGDVLHGLSIISEMMVSKAYIIVSVDGVAASMGAVLLAAADKVVMNDYARVMIHSPYYVDKEGAPVTKMSEKQKKGVSNMKDILCTLLGKRGISAERIAELMKTDSWFNAEDAKTENLVDEVITTGRKTELVALEPLKLVAKLVEENNNVKPKNLSMKKIAARFGLPEDSSEEVILAKMAEQQKAEADKAVDQLVKMGRALKTVNDKNEEKVRRLAKADFELASEMYLQVVDKTETEEEDETEEEEDAKPSKKQTLIKNAINKGGKPSSAKTEKKFEELSESEIETMRVSDKAGYSKVFKAYYGFEPDLD
jgi:ATP-dependent protease ClpP protease subunit